MLLSILSILSLTLAAPRLNFPFNSQLPPVARRGQQYTYTISSDTYVSDAGNAIQYEAANLPSWLSLNDRTLSGTPPSGSGDDSVSFQLTASDSTGSTTSDCVLQLSAADSPNYSAQDLQNVLESSGPVANSQSFVLNPGKSFEITFPDNFFTSNGRPVVGHYAVTSDHSPLPIWLNFDGSTGKFSGTAPAVNSQIAQAQQFNILYIVSTYEGFSSAAVEFTLLLGANVLAMNIGSDPVNATVEKPFTYDVPLSEITLDGEPIQQSDLAGSWANIPSSAQSWLKFDNSSYVLSGTPPADTAGTTVTVNIEVADIYHDAVSWDVAIDIAEENGDTVFSTSSLPPMNATRGEFFEYPIGEYLLNSDVSLSLDGSPDWLTYVSDNKTIIGQVPDDFQSGTVTLTATLLDKRDTTQRYQSLSAHFEIYGVDSTDSQSSTASSTESSTQTSTESSESSESTSSDYSTETSVSSTESSEFTSSASSTASSTASRTASSSSSTASSTSSATAAPVPVKKNSNTGVTVGCAVGIPVGLAVIAAIILFFVCARRRKNKREAADGANLEKGGPGGPAGPMGPLGPVGPAGTERPVSGDAMISAPRPGSQGPIVTPVFRTDTTDESEYDDALESPAESHDETLVGTPKFQDTETAEGDYSPHRVSTMNFMAMDNGSNQSQRTLAPIPDTLSSSIPEHEQNNEADIPRESWRNTNTDDRRWQDHRISTASVASVVPGAMGAAAARTGNVAEIPTVLPSSEQVRPINREVSSGILHRINRSSSQYSKSHRNQDSRGSDSSSDLTDESIGLNLRPYTDENGETHWVQEDNNNAVRLNNVGLDRKPSQARTPNGDQGEFAFV